MRMPLERRYIKRLLIACIVSVGHAILSPAVVPGETTAQTLLANSIFVPTGSMISILVFLYTCFGSLVFCYLFADFFEEGVSYSAIHVITRTHSRLSWFVKRIALLGAYVLAYVVFVDTCLVLMTGISLNMGTVASFVSLLFLNVLILQCVLVAMAFIGSFVGSLASYVITMCLYFLPLCLFTSLPLELSPMLAHLLPSTQAVLAIHAGVSPELASYAQLELLSLGYSYGYLIVLTLLITLALWLRFSKRDFL